METIGAPRAGQPRRGPARRARTRQWGRVCRVPRLGAGRRRAPHRLEADGARRPLLRARSGARQPRGGVAVAGRQRLHGRTEPRHPGAGQAGLRARIAGLRGRAGPAPGRRFRPAGLGRRRTAHHPAGARSRPAAPRARPAGAHPRRRAAARSRPPALRAQSQPGVRRQRLPRLALGPRPGPAAPAPPAPRRAPALPAHRGRTRRQLRRRPGLERPRDAARGGRFDSGTRPEYRRRRDLHFADVATDCRRHDIPLVCAAIEEPLAAVLRHWLRP